MRSLQLQQYFGILGNTTAPSKVLKGTYVAPEGSSKSVVGILQMIWEVAAGVKDRMVDILITLLDYIQYWKCYREKASSSVSVIHFGHWKAAVSINEVAEIHTMMTRMEFQSGNPIIQWC